MHDYYLKEIDCPSLIEPIDERFDGVTSLMTPNAVIYGSSLTSIISGLKANGDLDITISPSEYETMCGALQGSSKWLQIEGKTVPDSVSNQNDWQFRKNKKHKNPYEEIPGIPLDETVAFENITGAKVQLIKSKSNTTDHLHDALEVVRKVDFAFCGMAMDRYGRLMETLPHSYNDCLARVIRIANYRAGDDLDRMRDRIDKYLKRGWSLSISLDTIFENMRRVNARLKAKKPTESPSKGDLFVLSTLKGKFAIVTRGFYYADLNKSDVNIIALHVGKILGADLIFENNPKNPHELLLVPNPPQTQSRMESVLATFNKKAKVMLGKKDKSKNDWFSGGTTTTYYTSSTTSSS